jgi:hypothetical protein
MFHSIHPRGESRITLGAEIVRHGVDRAEALRPDAPSAAGRLLAISNLLSLYQISGKERRTMLRCKTCGKKYTIWSAGVGGQCKQCAAKADGEAQREAESRDAERKQPTVPDEAGKPPARGAVFGQLLGGFFVGLIVGVVATAAIVLVIFGFSVVAAGRGGGGAATRFVQSLEHTGATGMWFFLGAFTAGFVLTSRAFKEPGALRWYSVLGACVLIAAGIGLALWAFLKTNGLWAWPDEPGGPNPIIAGACFAGGALGGGLLLLWFVGEV